MDDYGLTRNQPHQCENLTRHLSSVVNSDIAFFEQHPERRFRARRANEAEIAQAESCLDKLLQAPEGECWFTIVKKVPGANLRMLVPIDPSAEAGLDLPDYIAEEAWDAFPSDALRIADVFTLFADPASVTGRSVYVTCLVTAEVELRLDEVRAVHQQELAALRQREAESKGGNNA